MLVNMKKALEIGFIVLQRTYFSKYATVLLKHNLSPLNNKICSNRFFYFLNQNSISRCLCQSKALYATQDQINLQKEKKTNDNSVIYFGNQGSKIKGLKVISYSSSLIMVAVQPYVYSDVAKLPLPFTAVLYSFLGLFTFVTPFLIHLITKRYITEIQYDSTNDLYTFKTITFFLRDKVDTFSLSDVSPITSPSPFATVNIKGRKVLLFMEGFLDQSHYIRLMGYDKPVDLKLSKSPEDSAK